MKAINSEDKGDPKLKQVYTPGRFSIRNKGPSCMSDPVLHQVRE